MGDELDISVVCDALAIQPGFASFVERPVSPDGQARIRAVSHETRSAVPSIVRTGIVA